MDELDAHRIASLPDQITKAALLTKSNLKALWYCKARFNNNLRAMLRDVEHVTVSVAAIPQHQPCLDMADPANLPLEVFGRDAHGPKLHPDP
jgi:hypothetical protein